MFIRYRHARQPLPCSNLQPMIDLQKTYFVYIMTNRSKTLSYAERTNANAGTGSSFAAKYKLDRLAYFEGFDDICNASEREKQIKGWLRIKKIALIVTVNPEWKDLRRSGMRATRIRGRKPPNYRPFLSSRGPRLVPA